MNEVQSISGRSKEIEAGMASWIKDVGGKAIRFPPNYSPENALKAAMLILAETKTGKETGWKPVLEVCTKTSIAFALQKMLTLGLNPAKKQCYFLAFKDKLGIMESYFGIYHIAKTCANVKSINCQIVYEGDDFEFELEYGVKKITKHKQTLESMDSTKIRAAYAVVTYNDGKCTTEIMPMGQIKKSWAKSTYGFNKETHGEFAEEMCKRTVLKKAVKLDINSSDDSNLFIEDDVEIAEEVRNEIKETEKTVIDIVDAEEVERTTETVEIEQDKEKQATPEQAPDWAN